MKVSGMWVVLWLLLGTVLMTMLLSSGYSATTLSSSDVLSDSSSSMTVAATGRRLKSGPKLSTEENIDNSHEVQLEDYRPIDPTPCSKASIRPGPIQHGTPLNPFIPKRPPPPSPSHGRSSYSKVGGSP